MNKLSIILPCYLRPHLLKWGLYSLTKQKINYPYQIIILNDGMVDETETICNYYKNNLNIHYIFTGQRNIPEIQYRSPGEIFNIGVNLAEGNLIILSSPEIYHLEKNSINNLVQPLLTQNKLLVTPKEGKDDNEGFFLRNLTENSNATYELRNVYYNYELTTPLNTQLNFCMAMHKEDFVNAGGFDKDFFDGFAYDDNNFIQTMLHYGCEYKFVDAKIIHLYHSRLPKDRVGLKNRDEKWLKNKKLFEEKWGKI